MSSRPALVVFAQYRWMVKSVCPSIQGFGNMGMPAPRQYSGTRCSLLGCARHLVLDVPCIPTFHSEGTLSHPGEGVHASVAGWDRPTCLHCLESHQVCLSPMAGVWPWGSCHAMPLSRPCNLCWDLAFWAGAATTQGASVVGTAYSRLLRAESCILHCLLIVGAGATIVGSPKGALGERWV